VHLIVGPARDERCVVLSLSCGARLRPGYPQHYCTLRIACCPADVAVPPVLPAGKEPRNFGLHRVKPRGRPPAHRHHPAAAECCAQADHPPDQGV